MESFEDDSRSVSPPFDRKPSPSSSISLAKGKACLECRRRKVRCNANHPCGGCIRMKKEDSCTYEDEVERVKRLQTKVAELEEKLRGLQMAAAKRTETPSEGASEGKGKEKEDSSSNASQFSAPQATFTSEIDLNLAGNWWKSDPPLDIQLYLINLFFTRATPKSGFRLHQERFIQSLTSEEESQPHPALLNVIYLLACYFSDNPELSCHQQIFITRTRHYMAKSLAQKDRLINFVAASTLLAYYLLRVGRFLECAHEISNAARFAMFCNLHKITSSICKPPTSPPDNSMLPETIGAGAYVQPLVQPPKDAIDLGERISLFWTVVLLDHSGSLVTGLPPNIPYQDIETVWPRALEDYELGQVSDNDESPGSLFEPNTDVNIESETTKHRRDAMKSIVLLGRVTSFATSATTYPIEELTTTDFLQIFRIHEDAIVRFANTLPPLKFLVTQLDAPMMSFSPASQPSPFTQSSPSYHTTTDSSSKSNSSPPTPNSDTESSLPLTYRMDPFFLIRTYVYTSFVHLYNAVHRSGETGPIEYLPGAYEERLKQARHVIHDIREMNAHDINITQLPVMLGFAWGSVAHVFAQHVRKLESSLSPGDPELTVAREELSCIILAIRALCDPFPILEFQLDRLTVYGVVLPEKDPVPPFPA